MNLWKHWIILALLSVYMSNRCGNAQSTTSEDFLEVDPWIINAGHIDILMGEIRQVKGHYDTEISSQKRITLALALNMTGEFHRIVEDYKQKEEDMSNQLKQQKKQLQDLQQLMTEKMQNLEQINKDQDKKIKSLLDMLSNNSLTILDHNGNHQTNKTYSNCADYYNDGYNNSGIYTIHVTNLVIPVYCDMSDGGGWTVCQRRINGSLNFYRNWADYKNGFGNVDGEHWLGNDIISAITNQNTTGYRLRVDAETFTGRTGYNLYTNFKVHSEDDNYRLKMDKKNGFPDDNKKGLSGNNGHMFTTHDKDNDQFNRNCALHEYKGGWWYSSSCGYTNLNGPYSQTRKRSSGDDFFWYPLDGFFSLKSSTMKLRPMDF